jgi:hypothetical protein
MIAISNTVHKVRSRRAGKTNDKPGGEEKGDDNALAESDISESEDDGDGDKDDTEIIHDVQGSLDHEMDLLIETALGYKRQGPVCGYRARDV